MWPKQEAKSWQTKLKSNTFRGSFFLPLSLQEQQCTPNSKQKNRPWTPWIPDVNHAPHGTPVHCFTTGKPKTERVESTVLTHSLTTQRTKLRSICSTELATGVVLTLVWFPEVYKLTDSYN